MFGGGYVAPTLTEVLFLLLVITAPALVSLGVGLLSGLFLPQMKVSRGAIVGLVIGIAVDICLIWVSVKWPTTPPSSHPLGASSTVRRCNHVWHLLVDEPPRG